MDLDFGAFEYVCDLVRGSDEQSDPAADQRHRDSDHVEIIYDRHEGQADISNNAATLEAHPSSPPSFPYVSATFQHQHQPQDQMAVSPHAQYQPEQDVSSISRVQHQTPPPTSPGLHNNHQLPLPPPSFPVLQHRLPLPPLLLLVPVMSSQRQPQPLRAPIGLPFESAQYLASSISHFQNPPSLTPSPLASFPALLGSEPKVFKPQETELEMVVREAVEKVQDGSFDEHAAGKFKKAAMTAISATTASNMSTTARFSQLVCARLNRLFMLERCSQVLNGLRFLYNALTLTGELEVYMHDDPEEEDIEVKLSEEFEKIETSLWKTVFYNTQFTAYRYEELLQLLLELRLMVQNTYKENPGVCCLTSLSVFKAYRRMRLHPNNLIGKTKHLVLVIAKCAYEKGLYAAAGKMAKVAAEIYFDMDDSDALEVWSKCCHNRGDMRLAVQCAELALASCQDRLGDEKRRLQKYLDSLRQESQMASHPHPTPEANPEWLQGQNVLHNALKSQQEKAQKVKAEYKKKKNKTKAIPKTRLSQNAAQDKMPHSDLTLKAIQQPAEPQTYRPYAAQRHHEEVVIEVDPWEELSGEDGEGLDPPPEASVDWSESESEEEEVHKDDAQEERVRKTWFEESQELYAKGGEEDELVTGEGLEINYICKPAQTGRGLRYHQLKDKAKLEDILATDPERYKRCRIELDGPHRATCKVLEAEQKNHKIEIHGRGKCGQTFNNDEVVVEILNPENDNSDTVFGSVVGTLSSKFQDLDFPLLACSNNPKEVNVMHPLCRSVPKIYIWTGRTRENHQEHKYRIDVYKIGHKRKLEFDKYFDILPNKRGQYVFLVVFLTWLPQHTYPKGAVLRVLDCGGDYASGLSVLKQQFRVPTYYTKATVTHVEELLKHDKLSVKGYNDLTEQSVFTIDPPHAKDLDDALSIWKTGDSFVVGVHIADVAAVVRKGDPVDKEAQQRATTFYPSSNWRSHNMLPEPLSQEKLSLLPGKERQVLSVLFVLDGNGLDLEKPVVKKHIIRSCRKFSYDEAQLIIDKKYDDVNCPYQLKVCIKQLHKLSQKIRSKRLKNSRFNVPFEDPRLLDVETLLHALEAHALVEEFMIKANRFIASWLMEHNRACVPLRCQDPPPEEELEKWIQEEAHIMDLLVTLQGKNIQDKTIVNVDKQCKTSTVHRTKYVTVQRNVWGKILEAVREKDLQTVRGLLCCDQLHPLQCLATSHWLDIMESAVYKCSGYGTGKDLQHYSLNIQPYTHFTSPIRRYVDLINHRLVHAVLEKRNTPPYTVEEMNSLCSDVTEACRRQRRFGRASTGVKQAEQLASAPMVFDAVVDSVCDSQVTLCIPSLKKMTRRSKELQFKLLDFCRRPEERRCPDINKTSVRGAWNKRIYGVVTPRGRQETKASQSSNTLGTEEVTIDSNMHTVHIQISDFAKLLKAVFENPDRISSVTRTLSPKGEHCYLNGTGVQKVVADCCEAWNINHHCRFGFNFSQGQMLRVQMHATADQGSLTPYVQMFQVCEDLNLCLSHWHDPVDTFAKYVKRSVRNREFTSTKDYQRTWLPLVEMESATGAVGSEGTIILKNLNVRLERKNDLIYGCFSLNSAFCDACTIEIDGKNFEAIQKMKTGESPFDDIPKHGSLEYICIRYTPNDFQRKSCIFEDSCVWIGHAVIKKIRKDIKSPRDDHGQIRTTFQLMPNSIPPPRHLLGKEFSALVEIIFKSEVDRRSEQMLRCLQDNEDSNLATSIALKLKRRPLSYVRLQVCKKSQCDILQGELVGSGYMPANNKNQEEAIKRALVEPFSLIQGPPGTGKTYTGLKLVYLFNKINKEMHSKGYDKEQRQILFCGPSNKSVDLVAKYLMQKLGNQCPKILRMYGKTIRNQDFPIPKRDFISKRSTRGLKSDVDLRSITLHYVIRQKEKPYAERINEYDAKFEKDPEGTNVSVRDIKDYNRLVEKAEEAELRICDVILCTCGVSGSTKLTKKPQSTKLTEQPQSTKPTRIFQCIIDESAMCPEPQSMIPIVATEAEQVVLIGDHQQLRPIVKSTHAAQLGLDQSLFERYKDEASFLNIQYRMHPKICKFPSDQFYDAKLITGPDRIEEARWYIAPRQELSIWPEKTNPKVFCHVDGEETTLTVSTEEGNEQSKSNMKEVEKVVDVFLYLVKTERIQPKNINVMSQYNAQRHAIREKLDLAGPFDHLNVQTVVASQGGEWDYVIFSTVRSLPHYKIEKNPTRGWCKHNLGFITDANQMNVSLTRARKGLIIIGNSKLLRCDPVWAKLLSKYSEEGENCFVQAADFPPPVRARGRNRGTPRLGMSGVLPRPV
ncbi:helicase with zinc finger domain 2-like isoform X1 [Haliotis rufescens]|uniref:helicase with zinc finger domain 2-like isoform X1 n=1 Tax=Haliotis rufescens TaxID=6454 RepID=UPI00201F0F4E|nr:helicase with zinc finger domain 2-like isoform X1 [Haliotis rufescens]XP_046355411.2 helicase with zinc finger domain 2-like isoform X1 [Haliotis rufescens]